MTQHNIEIPCNTKVLIRVTCKEAQPITVTEPLSPEPSPVIEPVVTIEPAIEEITPEVPLPVEPITIPIESEPIPVIEPITLPVIPPDPVTEPTPNPEPIPLPPVLIPNPVSPVQPIPDPVISPLPDPVSPEHCYCDLDSPLSLPDFAKQLTTLTKGLLYPSESDFPIEVLSKGFSSKMPPIKGIEVRNLDRAIPRFLRNVDPDDQQTGNLERAALANRWQALYTFIKHHSSVTAWHYPVKQNKYTHELMVLLLHPQGTVALRIKLVET